MDAGRSVEQHLEPGKQDGDILRLQPQDGFLGDGSVRLPGQFRRPQVLGELVECLVDDIDGLVMDLCHTVSHALGVTVDEGF